MRAGFTPGPWKVGRRSNGGYHHFISGSGWTDLARVVTRMRGREDDKPEGQANARLIAAAPELFDAAVAALELISTSRAEGKGPTNAEALLRLAVSKARGEQP